MILLPITALALLFAFEKQLAPYVHRFIEWYAGVRPLTVEQAHQLATRPPAPVAKRPRRWGVTRVFDAQKSRWA
jgi:hypothetical protein